MTLSKAMLLPPVFLVVAFAFRTPGTVVPRPPKSAPAQRAAFARTHRAGPSEHARREREVGAVRNAVPTPDQKFRRHVVGQVAFVFQAACFAFEHEEFLRCREMCVEILRVDAGYEGALRLQDLAARALHAKFAASPKEIVADLSSAVCTDTADPRIPYETSFRTPSQEHWELLGGGFIERALGASNAWAEDPTVPSDPYGKLHRMRLDLAFERTNVDDILAFIRDFSGLNILRDVEVRGAVQPDIIVTIHVKDMVLKDVLRLLMPFVGPDRTFTLGAEDVVLIISREKLAPF